MAGPRYGSVRANLRRSRRAAAGVPGQGLYIFRKETQERRQSLAIPADGIKRRRSIPPRGVSLHFRFPPYRKSPVHVQPSRTAYPWSDRWAQLAAASDLGPNQPVLVALSGGADSVFLLHLLAQAEPRPRILAMHVEHGLRGEESREDSAFCARLCAKLSIPFARTAIEVEGGDAQHPGPNWEAKARKARYQALAEEARAAGIQVILTGHHEDDALETLLMRMMRGSDMAGLAGQKTRFTLAGSPKVEVIRPLVSLRREEVRQILRREGLTWREDSSNLSQHFTRNRVRQSLLPNIAQSEQGMDGLRAFAQAVEGLEAELAERTVHLHWTPLAGQSVQAAGGRLSRAEVGRLPGALQRRALWRLLHEGTGKPPGKTVLSLIESDLAENRSIRRSLPGQWLLELNEQDLLLLPPSHGGGLDFPQDNLEVDLPVPGEATLPDGTRVIAEKVEAQPGASFPTQANVVELDAQGLPSTLRVRLPRAGDRFHALGAPGQRELTRFLADEGVSAADRRRQPLVMAEDELVWVAGVRPCESRRVGPQSTQRVRLRLEPSPAQS